MKELTLYPNSDPNKDPSECISIPCDNKHNGIALHNDDWYFYYCDACYETVHDAFRRFPEKDVNGLGLSMNGNGINDWWW